MTGRWPPSLYALCALALLAACSTTTPPAAAPASSSPSALAAAARGDTLLTVWQRSDRTRRLELRSGVDGHVVAVVLGPTRNDVTATRLAPTRLLLATTVGCRTRLERLDLATGRRTFARDLDRPAYGLTPSPDARRIAFLTMPSCSPPVQGPHPRSSSAVEAYLPNVLAVTGLDGGPVLTTATDERGHPLSGPSWSPDGTSLVSTYLGDGGEQLRVFHAAAPAFGASRVVPAARGCRLSAGTWTDDGIVADERCGADPVSVRRLVRVSPAGRITGSWPMPDCLSSADGVADPARPRLDLVLHIGYGGGACGRLWADRLAVLDLTRPGTPPRVLQDRRLRFASSELEVAGW
jgi:hypothetical protein